jgi:hypothetical protein
MPGKTARNACIAVTDNSSRRVITDKVCHTGGTCINAAVVEQVRARVTEWRQLSSAKLEERKRWRGSSGIAASCCKAQGSRSAFVKRQRADSRGNLEEIYWWGDEQIADLELVISNHASSKAIF